MEQRRMVKEHEFYRTPSRLIDKHEAKKNPRGSSPCVGSSRESSGSRNDRMSISAGGTEYGLCKNYKSFEIRYCFLRSKRLS